MELGISWKGPLYQRSKYFDQGLHSLNFKSSPNQPGVYFANDMVVIIFVDDTIYFGKYGKKIYEVIKRPSKMVCLN